MKNMQERDKFNTSCREHSVEITIDHVTRHIAWKRDDCPVCRIISLEQQLATAHREGWEQCQRECVDKILDSAMPDISIQPSFTYRGIANMIASMEYGGPNNGD